VTNLDYSFAVHAYDTAADLRLNLFEGHTSGPGTRRTYDFMYTPATGAQTLTLVTPIDIKPGEASNSINPRSQGVVPVAILSTQTFNASSIDPNTVRFGATGREASPLRFSLEDVNGDGTVDMVLHFKTQQTAIACGQTSATLTGITFDGLNIQGSDRIATVGGTCK